MQLNYGNWIRKKNLLILGLCTLGAFLLILIPLGLVYRIVMACVCIILAVSFLIPLYSYIMFSHEGGRFQEKVYQLIIQRLGRLEKAKILDIGSGNGVLAVLLAQQNPGVDVTGVDYWGKDWEYSKSVCEQNAQAGKVADRVRFQKGDAAALEFAADSFDGVTSNLTFHEVQSVADKRAVLREALRVVKPGGRFSFVDYFFEAKYYGESPAFQEYLKSLAFAQFEFKPLREEMPIPAFLLHPKIFGKVGIIYGRK